MRKVKLVFQRSFVEIPTMKDTFSSDVEVLVPDGFGNMHLIGARVYEAPNLKDIGANIPADGDSNAIIVDYRDFQNLLGKLLTYVDATYTDPEQRKAHKDIIKNNLWGWEKDLRQRGIQTNDSHDSGSGSATYPVKATSITRVISGQTIGNDDTNESVLDTK